MRRLASKERHAWRRVTLGIALWLPISLASIGSAGAEPTVPSEASGETADAEALPEEPTRRLRVGVTGSAPFVIRQPDGSFEGASIEVWKSVALRAGVSYELVPVANVTTALEEVASGTLDTAVGPITITAERAEEVSFTQPYHETSLAILARPGGSRTLAKLAPFLSKAFIVGVGVLLFVLFIVGTLLWLTERRHNPEQFPPHPVRGIGNGIWMALVTMTTVGYGDLAPVSVPGRVVAGVWMVVAMLTASSLTASIATALTLSELDQGTITRAEQLGGNQVAVMEGTPSAAFARRHGARVSTTASTEAAIATLERGDVEAVVGDKPVLAYYLAQHPASELVLSEASYEPQGYGFAVPLRSPLLPRYDVAVLSLTEDGEIEAIFDRWF